MRELLMMIKEHKIIMIAIWVILILFILWSFWQFFSNKEKDEVPEQKNAVTQNEQITDGSIRLNKDQMAVVKDYTDEQKEFIAYLTGNVWSDESQTATLTFTDTTYTESVGADKISHPFAITAIADDQIIGDKVNYESKIIAVDNGTDTFIMKMWRWVSESGGESEWNLSSGSFTKSATYKRTAAADNLEIQGLTEDIYIQFGGQEKVDMAIKEYVSLTYPTATKATWREDVSHDYKNGILTTAFTLNTKTSAVITVTYNKASGLITIT